MKLPLPIVEAYDAHRAIGSQPFRAACYAPFTSLMFDTTGLVRPCCANYAYILGDLRTSRLSDIWNNARLYRLRQAMMSYDFSLGCGDCGWKISCGPFEGPTGSTSSITAYAFDQYGVAQPDPIPRHFEFQLSNACNLACTTCWGEFSTAIRSQREKLPPMARPYGESFFEDVARFLPNLQAAQFKGGEPFLVSEHHRIWEMLIQGGHHPACQITTNGTQWSARVERVVQSLPVSICVSMDGATKRTFEALRVNADFDSVLHNVKRFDDIGRPQGRPVSISFVLSRLNWFEFGELLLMMEKLDICVFVCVLQEPRKHSLYTLAKSQLAQILHSLEREETTLLPQLSRNRTTRVNQLNLLRIHYQSIETTHEKEKVDYLSQAVEDSVWSEISEWSRDFPAIAVWHDEQFVIHRIEPATLADGAPWKSLLGQTIDELNVTLKRCFGGRVNVLEEVHASGRIFRLLQYLDGPTPVIAKGYWLGAGPGQSGQIAIGARRGIDRRLEFLRESSPGSEVRLAQRESDDSG